MPAQRQSILVKACLNGGRPRGEHASVPLAPRELAAAARAAVAAGAGALHVHPRLPNESETLDPEACGSAIREIRAACPGVPIGLSTGAWIEDGPERRRMQIARWAVRPEFVSVNFSEPGTRELCDLLVRREIGIEAGLWTRADAEAFAGSGIAASCLRVLIEPQETDLGEALATARDVEDVLDRMGIRLRRLLHGNGTAAWGVLEVALRRAYDIRIGFEDTLALADGTPAKDNAELVAAAVDLARRRGMTPEVPATLPRHEP